MRALILAAVLLSSGCRSTKPAAPRPEPAQPAPELTGTVQRASVHVGVLSTKDGTLCPGADIDVTMRGDYWRSRGCLPQWRLVSRQASFAGIRAALDAAWETGDGPEDIIVVTISGHGTWLPDRNGDEPSGKDSAWVLYDRLWIDDDVWGYIRSKPPRRLVIEIDTCHSGGSWRFWRPRRVLDVDAVRGSWGGSVVCLAACMERESAIGNRLGGQWSTALTDAGVYAHTLRQLFEDAKSITQDQTPTLETYGTLGESMLDSPEILDIP